MEAAGVGTVLHSARVAAKAGAGRWGAGGSQVAPGIALRAPHAPGYLMESRERRTGEGE